MARSCRHGVRANAGSQSTGELIGARHLANGRPNEREAYRNAAPGRLQTQATMMPERARHPEMGQGFRKDDAPANAALRRTGALANAKPKRTRRLTNASLKRRRLANGDSLQTGTSLANEGRRIRSREARDPSERGAEEARGFGRAGSWTRTRPDCAECQADAKAGRIRIPGG